MATFDPQFNTETPSWLNLSRASQQPEADKSTGIALETVGKGIAEGFDLADTTVKNVLKDTLATDYDKKREEFLTQLDQLQGKGDGQDLEAPSGKAPADVEAGINEVQRLQNAKTQSGKFRTTDLDARMFDTLKDLRNRFPGYRDYIDAQSSKIAGHDVANKLISDRIAQLNESRSNAQKEQEYWEKQIVNSGYHGAPEMLQKFQQNHNVPWVQQWLAKEGAVKGDLDRQKADFQMQDAKNSNTQMKAENFANSVIDEAATANFRNRQFIQNDPSSFTSSQVQDALNELSLHPEKRDPEQIRNLGMQLQALEGRNAAEVKAALDTVKTADGRTASQILGPKRVQELIDAKMGGLYGVMHKQLSDAQFGLVNATQNAAVDIIGKKGLQVLESPTTANVAQTGAALNKLFPTMSPDLIKEIFGSGAVKDVNGNASSFGSELLKLKSVQAMQAIAQTGGAYDGPGVGGKVYTLRQFFDEQSRAQKITNEPDANRAQAITGMLRLRKAITEKDPRVQDAAINFFFDPTNQMALNRWLKPDYTDGNNIIEGRHATIRDLTTPEITKAVWDRAHNGNGLAWENYKGFVDRHAVSNLTTIAQTWNVNEQQYKNQSILPGAEKIPTGTDHHFFYNTDTQQIGVTDLKGNVITEDKWRLKPDLFEVRNANILLKSLKNVAEQEGTDPNAYVFRALKQAGWAPDSIDARGKSTISERIMKAVITSHTPPKPEGKEKKE